MQKLGDIARLWGLPLFLFLLPWQTRYIFDVFTIVGEPFEYGTVSVYALEFFLLALVLLNGKFQISAAAQKPARYLLFVLAVVVVSMFGVRESQVAANVAMHVAFAGLLFLFLLDERIHLRRVGAGFVLGLIAPLALGAWQVFAGSSPAVTWLGLAARDAGALGDSVIELADGTRQFRAYGSFSHPNIFGGFLAVGALATTWLGSKQNGWKQYALFALLGTFLIGLTLTGSRSALLGLGFALLAGFFAKKKLANPAGWRVEPANPRGWRIGRKTLAAVGVFLVLALGTRYAVQGFAAGEFESRSVEERVEQVQEFLSVVDGEWLFGHGIGQYTYAIEAAFPEREWWEYQPVHNVPLLVVGEIGLVGLIALVLWIATIDRINFSRLPKEDALFAFMAGNTLLVVALFDHYLWTNWQGLALAAFVLALRARLKE